MNQRRAKLYTRRFYFQDSLSAERSKRRNRNGRGRICQCRGCPARCKIDRTSLRAQLCKYNRPASYRSAVLPICCSFLFSFYEITANVKCKTTEVREIFLLLFPVIKKNTAVNHKFTCNCRKLSKLATDLREIVVSTCY